MSEELEAPFILRDFRKDDEGELGFLMRSWLKTFRFTHHSKMITNSVYYAEQKAICERLLAKSNVVLAVNPEDESHLFGYVVYEKVPMHQVFHYVYVKKAYQRLGLAKKMIGAVLDPSQVLTFTHFTLEGGKLIDHFQMQFNPYWGK